MKGEKVDEIVPNNYPDGIMPGDKLTPLFRMAIRQAIEEATAKGIPIARYDEDLKKAFLEHPDGRREYMPIQSELEETHVETERSV